ncbi:outer membrane protein assembly factor BamC [Shewanella yunxiaonensis]|uniref:Outer membrane protein assembly factor BamC n=1 Tax=Shewanella yunxiaonensis TaxID=2829809 RepID=A0ABX7YPI6_9GAMM|nr:MULTISPECIES: outer membrane protein assembly factor BamC [Shewanella]MDF0535758.1 outer membrane protein assembly factor BamC [Shewanella sp. A32]QUN04448.1 outer membrane protein assembly factor BamC [Shewanella yunxiaonensis]
MLKLKEISLVLAALTVTACTTPLTRRQADGNFDYINAQSTGPLKIPEGLLSPKFSQDYAIPAVGTKSNKALVGDALDIRPPLQILPMADGTHIEEGADNIKVVVETIDSTVDLKKEMFAVVEGFLKSKDYAIAKEDYDNGVIDTDWIEHDEVIDSPWIGADKVYKVRQRYEFLLEVRPHGRTGNLVINLLDHQQSYNGEDSQVLLNNEDKKRYAIDMLNSTIGYMAKERSRIVQNMRVKQSKGIDVTYVTAASDKDESFWLADAPLKSTWDRLAIVLPEVGFEVIDMDSAKGLYYVKFNDTSGFWSSLFSDDEIKLKNKDNYRLLVKQDAKDSNKTEIRIRDNEDQPLSNDKVESVYKAVSNVMSEDRKVR